MAITIEQREEGNELVQKLVIKAWENATFKEQLINNPKTAIEKVVGKEITIPKGSKIVIDDQTNHNIVYLNIPRKINIEDYELSEEELEEVSGGCGGACVAGLIIGGAQVLDWIGQGWNMV